MTINNREIIFVTYSTAINWVKDIPKSNWLCLLVDNDRPRRHIDEVISKIIDNNVCYVCTIGKSCEKNHDLIDEEIAFRDADIADLHLPKHQIITTWHKDFEEGIWFSIFATLNDESEIQKVVILDMTDREQEKRIKNLIENY